MLYFFSDLLFDIVHDFLLLILLEVCRSSFPLGPLRLPCFKGILVLCSSFAISFTFYKAYHRRLLSPLSPVRPQSRAMAPSYKEPAQRPAASPFMEDPIQRRLGPRSILTPEEIKAIGKSFPGGVFAHFSIPGHIIIQFDNRRYMRWCWDDGTPDTVGLLRVGYEIIDSSQAMTWKQRLMKVFCYPKKLVNSLFKLEMKDMREASDSRSG